MLAKSSVMCPKTGHKTDDDEQLYSTTKPMGVKGVGEAGTIASTPAVMNAVVDALRPLGVTDVTMPASPMTVRRSIEAAAGDAS